MKALIEIGALCLLPWLIRLCRSGGYIRVRVRTGRQTSNAFVLVGVAVLIAALAAFKA